MGANTPIAGLNLSVSFDWKNAMYYVYVLRVKKSGRHYIGQTQDLAKRLEKHSRGKTKSMKNRAPFDVVYIEKCSSRAEAMRREKEVKRYKGGEAFRRLLSGFTKQKITTTDITQVPLPNGWG